MNVYLFAAAVSVVDVVVAGGWWCWFWLMVGIGVNGGEGNDDGGSGGTIDDYHVVVFATRVITMTILTMKTTMIIKNIM